jgi:type II secretory pathway pseudopilin PulG
MKCRKTDDRPGVRTAQRRREGFTLIEALAAIMVMVIVIPVLLRGFGIAQLTAVHSLRRAESTAIAQSKLDEIIATQSWATTGLPAGDETVGQNSYHFEATLTDWDSGEVGVQVLTMTVSWDVSANETRKVELTTLLWVPGSTIQTESSSSSGLTGGLLP